MKKLLFTVTIKDCRVDYFTVSGAGGGGKDTSNTGVRITHRDSGAVGRAVETRSQTKNKRLAFKRMAETKEFRAWTRIHCARLRGDETLIKARVDKMMNEVKVQVQDEKGRWIDES